MANNFVLAIFRASEESRIAGCCRDLMISRREQLAMVVRRVEGWKRPLESLEDCSKAAGRTSMADKVINRCIYSGSISSGSIADNFFV
jgi:hypothetical protein